MESVVPEKGVVDAAKSESLSRHTQALLFGVKDIGAGKVVEGDISKIQRSLKRRRVPWMVESSMTGLPLDAD